MNKRQESKIKTRELIIEKTNLLIKEKGVIALTTVQIAESCCISHGSIFQHFGNRDNLINYVLEEEIKKIASFIKERCLEKGSSIEILDKYIEIISMEEELFIKLYKDLPFLSEEIKLSLISTEAIIRNAFYLSIKESKCKLTDKELSIALDAFFSMIIRLLTLKELYTPTGSVILERKNDIKTLYYILFQGGGVNDAGEDM